jgi:replication factor C subunit 1
VCSTCYISVSILILFRGSWVAKKAAQLAGPVAHGSKEVPDGAPDALAGLSFVFTGELSSFSREEATDLGKRFGGLVISLST